MDLKIKGRPRGRPFKKGNQEGKKSKRGKVSDEHKISEREARRIIKELSITLNKSEVQKIVMQFMNATRDELQEIASDKKTRMIELLFISLINKGFRGGDEKKVNFLLEFMYGKEKDKVEITGHNNTPFNNSIEVVFTKTNETDEED